MSCHANPSFKAEAALASCFVPCRRFFGFGWALLGLIPWLASAQLPVAKLVSIFPAGAAAGSTNEVSVTALDFDEPQGLRFSDPRISATPSTTNPTQFTILIPSEVSPGWVDVRWVGRFGVSNPRVFSVSDRAETIVTGTNSSLGTAMKLPLNFVVNGQTKPNQVSWFRFDAARGQRLVVKVEARELDSRLEPVLSLSDAQGHTLGQSRRGFLEFRAPADGEYGLQLHDVTYRGGDDFVYRLNVTPTPFLDFAVPNVLTAGVTNQVVVYGRNLPDATPSGLRGADGEPLDAVTVELIAPSLAELTPLVEGLRKPAAMALATETWKWSFPSNGGTSNPLLFSLTTLPIVASATNGLVAVTPPVEFCGVFPRRGESNGVQFVAKKGDIWWLELFADRLGWPCDPSAVVQRQRNTKGEAGEVLYADVLELTDTEANLGGADFNTATRDSAARFEAPEEGTYRVLVRDLFNSGPLSPKYPYRLSLRRETPEFALAAVPVQPVRQNDNDRNVYPWTPLIRRDETLPVKVIAFRRDGFAGELELSVTNLPAGLTAMATRIPSGQNVGYVLLTATEDGTTPVVGRLEILGRARMSSTEIVHSALLTSVVKSVGDFNDQAVATRAVKEPLISLSGVEAAPVSIRPTETKSWEVSTNGKLVLPVNVTRRGEFKAALSLKPAGRPELDKVKPASVAENATNATLEFDLTEAKLPEGAHTVWLQGTVAGKYQNNPEALVAATAEVKAAEQALTAASEGDKAKLEERKNAAETRRKAAEEKAKPRDVTWMVYSRPFVLKIVPPPSLPAAKP